MATKTVTSKTIFRSLFTRAYPRRESRNPATKGRTGLGQGDWEVTAESGDGFQEVPLYLKGWLG